MDPYLIASLVVVLLAAMGGLGVVGLLLYLKPKEEPAKGPGEAVEARLTSLELTVKGFPSLWEEERKRAERAADSARKARDSAAKKLAELDELEEETPQLQRVDEIGGRADGMQDVRGNLGTGDDSDLLERAKAVGWLMGGPA